MSVDVCVGLWLNLYYYRQSALRVGHFRSLFIFLLAADTRRQSSADVAEDHPQCPVGILIFLSPQRNVLDNLNIFKFIGWVRYSVKFAIAMIGVIICY